MKPWLLNVLACPICKNHPLNLTILNWEPVSLSPPSSDDQKLLLKELQDDTVSPKAFEVITDQSSSESHQSLLEKIRKILPELQSSTKKTLLDDLTSAHREQINYVYEYFYQEILDGYFQCTSCHRWYPLGNQVKGIPELLPDNLRDPFVDKKFLTKYQTRLPNDLLEQGTPNNLHTEVTKK